MSTIPPLKVDTNAPGYVKLHQQAKDLEGVFLNTLMKEMFSSVKTSEDAFGGGFAEETWRGMQAEQLAAAVAANGGVGLADAIVGDLFAAQQAASLNPSTQGTRP
jgi:Rod binding domain-containing protein